MNLDLEYENHKRRLASLELESKNYQVVQNIEKWSWRDSYSAEMIAKNRVEWYVNFRLWIANKYKPQRTQRFS